MAAIAWAIVAAMTTPASPRSRVRRAPARGHYDRETINAIIDEAVMAHVAVVDDGQPVVVPMICARDGDRLILHGSSASRTMRLLADGAPACAAITHLDGLVLARSAFHHSANYRSVVVLGTATRLDGEEALAALDGMVRHVNPEHHAGVRGPNEAEMRQTLTVALPLDESSAKIRTGGPNDDPEDMDLPVWAGVVPLSVQAGAPIRDGGAG